MKSISYDAAFVAFCFLSGRAFGQTIVDQNTTIDFPVYDGLRIVDGATVDVVTNGDIRETTEVFDNSTLNVTTGGTLLIHAYDTSVVNYTSGQSTNISTYDFSTVTHSVEHLDHGEVDHLNTYGMSTVHLIGSAGHIWSSYDFSTINITSGRSDFLQSYSTSEINILGGAFDPSARDASRINIRGGMIGSLSAGQSEQDGSTIVVYGSGFNYPLGKINDSAGTLTGRLSNGDPIDADFQIIGGSSIVLVPEAGSLPLLLLGWLVLAGRCHKRS